MPFIATRSLLMRLALCLSCSVGSGRALAQESPPPSSDVRYVAVEGTPMRSAPSGTARRLGTVARGTAVIVRSQRGTWAEIELPDDGQSAWISLRALSLRRPRRSDAEIRRILIRESIDDYSGNCPCPYFTDSIGRSCGRRSAWSRAGGESPYCYPRDVPPEAVEAWRQANEAPPAVVAESRIGEILSCRRRPPVMSASVERVLFNDPLNESSTADSTGVERVERNSGRGPPGA